MSASDESSKNKRKTLGIKPDAPSGKQGGDNWRPPVRGRHLPNTAKNRTKAASEARAPKPSYGEAHKPFSEPSKERSAYGKKPHRDARGGDRDDAPRRRPRPGTDAFEPNASARPRSDTGAPRHAARRVDENTYKNLDTPRYSEDIDTRPARTPVPPQEVRHGPRGGPRGEPRSESRKEVRGEHRPESRGESQSESRDSARANTSSALHVFFVPCPKGLEGELTCELGEIGVTEVRPAPGGVAFRGSLPLAWKVNLWSRLAVRVMWRVSEGPYREEADLYTAAMRVDWPSLFHVERTIAVTTLARNSPLQSLNFVTLKIKDAVCDRFRSYCGERPSVETHSPDVPLVVYLTDERYSLYIDLSGEPLNRRGFRVEPAAAPLNENLAAGLLRLSGWKPGTPFFDPMMGGGTLLIEAAMMWLNRAPGLNRHFAFERLSSFDRIEWQRIRKTAEAEAHEPENLPIFGSDIDPNMIRAAGLNLQAADLLDCVNLLEADFLEIDAPPTEPGIIVSNPPYGVRLELEDMAAFYRGMGDALKKRYPGWSAYFISADEQLPKTIGLSASRRTPLFNGPLECRFYAFNIVAGSNRRESQRPKTG